MTNKKNNLTAEGVKNIAYLARLPISDTEVRKFTPQLEEILNYFSKLEEVDTGKVKPTYHSIFIENRFQEQKLESDTLSQNDVLKNVKDAKDGYVRTGQVIK